MQYIFRMKRLTLITTLALLLSGAGLTAQVTTRRDSIRSAIEYQISHYPASQYCDVYKNFMQDFYGPGHILNDTVAASRYLRTELSETSDFGGPLYEPTGFNGNFYRVNISLIKDGTVPYPVFFKAFVESVQGINPPAIAEWRSIWNDIDDVIRDMNLNLANDSTDRSGIMRQLDKGDFVVHHSEAYNKATNFHYRIISKELFESRILPLISDR